LAKQQHIEISGVTDYKAKNENALDRIKSIVWAKLAITIKRDLSQKAKNQRKIEKDIYGIVSETEQIRYVLNC
jgi:hypothetical protein